jgi:nicotinate-nucleotide adenylyltransferase
VNFAILGGSFNPVHVGHLFLADAVLTGLAYDRVLLVPAFESPFKAGANKASPKDRLDMLAASITGDPRLAVDDCEIIREGISYTIDTIKDIGERYKPKAKLGLILGDDLAAAFPQWRKASEISELTDIIIARRLFSPPNRGDSAPGGDEASPGPDRDFPYPYKGLNNEIMNVSSRLVREKILRGENWRYLVPAGARYIIEDRGLYGYKPAGAAVTADTGVTGGITLEKLVFLEKAVCRSLNPSRFLHSRNTALLARDLCLRYGLDPQAGYLAGITHDMCKSMAVGELVRLAGSDGGKISDLEAGKPHILHGRAAAVLLRERYGITDQEILDAVRFHTMGSPAMGDLAKVVYIADKIEVSRKNVGEGLREMSRSADLDELFAAVVEDSAAWLRSRGIEIAGSTRQILSVLGKGNKG